MPATLNSPMSHRVTRRLTRGLFRMIGLFQTPREAGKEEGLPWQARVILRLLKLAEGDEPPSPAKMRKLYRLLTIPYHISAPPMAEVRDHTVPGGPRLRLYRPRVKRTGETGEPAPALAYFHGGGGVVGDLETHDPLCRYLAAQAGVVIISVEYRLGPEHKHPAQIEDVHSAFRWVRANAGMLDIDAARIGAGGDSAGAYLALLLACKNSVSPTGAPPGGAPPGSAQREKPDFLWLVYPFTGRDADTPSRLQFTEGLVLTTPLMDYFRSHMEGGTLLPSLDDGDFAALPPALVVTAGFDPLRDEGLALAAHIKSAGVQVTHLHYAHLLHEFISMGGVVPEARAALDEAAAQLKSLALRETVKN